MPSVLFVCLGNICRSPMAEAIFLAKLRQRGIESRYQVDSAGTGAWHAGETADPRTLATLKRHAIPYNGRARAVRLTDFTEFDYLVAMDQANVDDLHRLKPLDSQAIIARLLEWDPKTPTHDVPDPYYGGPEGFENIYRLIDQATTELLNELELDESP